MSDVLFMNYRKTWCARCERVLYLQPVDSENRVVVTWCDRCGRSDGVNVFHDHGYEGCMLVWGDEEVFR